MQEATGSSVSAEVMYSGVNAAILLDEDISINTHWNSFWARLINLGTLIDVLIIPKLIVLYGFEPPDVDGNCQIKVLVYDIDGAFGTLGYFAPSMASTQENLYIDADDVEQLSDVNWTSSLAAHELSHLMMNSIDPSENLWVDEGVADYIAGFITGSNYILRSHVNSWTTDSGIGLRWWNQRIADYGASTLMMAYLHGHLGDQAFADLLNSQQQGAIGVQTILAQYAANNTIGTDFSSLFANFTVAAGLDFEGTIWDIPRIELADTCGQQACVIQAQDSGEFYASASPIQFSFSSQSELESWGVHRYVFDNVTEGTLSVISNTSSAEFNGIIAILESDGDVRTQSFEAPENDGVRGRLITSDVDRIEVYVWDETGGDCDYTSCGPTYPIIDYELDVILSFSDDTDEDGVEDLLDDCPFGESNWTSSPSTDQDADGCKDANEDDDDDGDGIEDQYDAFPDDPTEFEDSDGDGVGDNSDLFPQDGNESEDSDGDGVGDNADAFPNDANETVDSDGDGVGDYADAFPDDVNETTDSDDDGVGDNADHLPFDANETVDSDGDGIGDNTDEFPFDRFEFVDSDGDGIGDNGDAFPNDANETADSDGDGIGDNGDAFPNDANETADSDGDGIGDNGDAFPNDANETVDSDQDGVGDNGDAFPEDANETVDSDQDGVGDNGDDFPEDANETVDSDQDGVGDNGDAFPNDPDRNESSNGSELLNFLGFGLSTGDIVGIAIALIGSLISIVFAISRRATKKKRLKLIKTLLDKIERSQSDVELSSVNKEIDKMFKDDLLSSDNLALLSTKIRNRKDEVQDTHHFSRNEVQEIHHSPSSKYT
jgi:hypothetical protein